MKALAFVASLIFLSPLLPTAAAQSSWYSTTPYGGCYDMSTTGDQVACAMFGYTTLDNSYHGVAAIGQSVYSGVSYAWSSDYGTALAASASAGFSGVYCSVYIFLNAETPEAPDIAYYDDYSICGWDAWVDTENW